MNVGYEVCAFLFSAGSILSQQQNPLSKICDSESMILCIYHTQPTLVTNEKTVLYIWRATKQITTGIAASLRFTTRRLGISTNSSRTEQLIASSCTSVVVCCLLSTIHKTQFRNIVLSYQTMRVSSVLLSMLASCRGAKAFVGRPRRWIAAASAVTLRGGSSDTAVAVETASAKELYPELVQKLETITHLGMLVVVVVVVWFYINSKQFRSL